MNAAVAAAGPLVARVLLAAIFLYSGYTKLVAINQTAAALAGRGIPLATAGAWVAGLAEVVGGAALVAGLKTRHAALALVAYVVVVTYFFHLFPALRGNRAQILAVLKNAGIAGGLLLLACHGPGRASVDRG